MNPAEETLFCQYISSWKKYKSEPNERAKFINYFNVTRFLMIDLFLITLMQNNSIFKYFARQIKFLFSICLWYIVVLNLLEVFLNRFLFLIIACMSLIYLDLHFKLFDMKDDSAVLQPTKMNFVWTQKLKF